nr:hypothetical protein Iba_chr01aCG13100 [Ipomoea batatas]GMC51935.1 hypothetical protein Iba_chr01cCG10870 [Ipomoea batatas]
MAAKNRYPGSPRQGTGGSSQCPKGAVRVSNCGMKIIMGTTERGNRPFKKNPYSVASVSAFLG